MYAVIPQIEIVPRILRVQGQVVLGLLERIFNNGSWHAQTPVVANHRANRCASLNAMWCCVVKTYFFKNPEDVFVDRRDARIA